ncbi:MAG: hypothetical protein JST66_08870 [Bacteroidetes bacterium]|nr:hypothetical protein [Bacteroidota bacterium]
MLYGLHLNALLERFKDILQDTSSDVLSYILIAVIAGLAAQFKRRPRETPRFVVTGLWPLRGPKGGDDSMSFAEAVQWLSQEKPPQQVLRLVSALAQFFLFVWLLNLAIVSSKDYVTLKVLLVILKYIYVVMFILWALRNSGKLYRTVKYKWLKLPRTRANQE